MSQPIRDKVVERKIRYDQSIVEYNCNLLERHKDSMILLYRVAQTFTIPASSTELVVPKGSYTIAYYWKNRPYNVYILRNEAGGFIGAYFNIVRNTLITEMMVSFEDLIIDVLVLPDGRTFILDEEELPESLDLFEHGQVNRDLRSLLDTMEDLLPAMVNETEMLFRHDELGET
jgi:predicted RNA-binding protein associated with RNAse of E/G family